MIVTFYSYKGGVGRSMAMANVADILAHRGARVLMIDFDLEAPGLEQYFEVPQESARAHEGLIDLLSSFKEALAVGGGRRDDFRDVERFVLPIYKKLPGGGSLDLMPAGKREGADLDRYATAVRSFDWQDFYFNWEGELFFEWLREELTATRYDLVLVDSRTGVTEMGGICSYQLADQIVMLCAANRQNVRGTRNVAEDFTSPLVMARRQDRPLGLVIVPARIEQRDPELLRTFLDDFERTFKKFMPERLSGAALSSEALMIPYQPEFAFDERVVTDPVRSVRRAGIGGAFLELARAITLLAPADSAIGRIASRFDEAAASIEYDATTRFGGYDVQLAGSATIRDQLDRLRQTLATDGAETFLDVIEPLPQDEWKRRSEQILFHSKILLVVVDELTAAQMSALTDLVRANRNSRNRPVELLSLCGDPVEDVARVLGLDISAYAETREAQTPEATIARVMTELGLSAPREITRVTRGATRGATRAAAASEGANAQPSPSPAQYVSTPQPLVPEIAPSAAATPSPPPPAPPPARPPAPPGSSTRILTPAFTSIASAQPFQGGDPFREEGAGYFFGRERLIADLVAAIEAQPRVWLLGPSGSGKTSAVLAGVFPILRARAPGRMLERIAVDESFPRALDEVMSRVPQSAERNVLFIDDMEGALDLPSRNDILSSLAQLSNTRRDVVVLLGLREDVVKAFTAAPLSLDLDSPSTIWVPDFTTGELRAAIERPAEKGGLAFEPGLCDRILTDAGLQASALGLVQKVLYRLWENRREGWLTNAGYERIGGIGAVVGEIGDAALNGFAGDTESLDHVLSRLVSLEVVAVMGAGAQGNAAGGAEVPTARATSTLVVRRRRCVPTSELWPATGDPTSMQNALRHLTRTGLVVARVNDTYEPCVELVHDMVLERSTRLFERVERLKAEPSQREFLIWRGRFGDALARGEEVKGKALKVARGWQSDFPAALNAAEQHAITRAVRDQRRLRSIFAAFAVVIVVGLPVREQAKNRRTSEAANAVAAGDQLAKNLQWSSAIDSFTVALDRAPNRDLVLLLRGHAYAGASRLPDAINDYTAALALNPKLDDARAGRAAAHLAAGNYVGAMQDYDTIIAQNPKAADAYFNRAAARDRSQGDADSTLADFAKAFASDSTQINALFESGRIEQRRGRPESAVAHFQRFLVLATSLNDQTAAIARLSELLGRPSTAASAPRPAVARATIFLHYGDRDDSTAVEAIRREIKRSGAFEVPAIDYEVSASKLTVAELRFPEGDDRYITDVVAIAEAALAKAGYRQSVVARVLSQSRKVRMSSGRLEIWFPPLSRSSYSAPNKS